VPDAGRKDDDDLQDVVVASRVPDVRARAVRLQGVGTGHASEDVESWAFYLWRVLPSFGLSRFDALGREWSRDRSQDVAVWTPSGERIGVTQH
jgi:hypothetical protein